MEKGLRQVDSDCIKICLFGPESSGKSTLSRKLSAHYNAPLVPEYAREYLQNLWDTEQKICRPKDVLPIARGQMKLENEMAKNANNILFCDTNVLEIKAYSEVYYNGVVPEILNKILLENVYDLYLLTYIDIPWVPDDLRDKPHQREEMFLSFKNSLEKHNYPYVIIEGDATNRFKKAVKAIDELIASKSEYFR